MTKQLQKFIDGVDAAITGGNQTVASIRKPSHGLPERVFREIGKMPATSKAASKVLPILRKKEAARQKLYNELVAVASQSPGKLREKHLDEMGARLANGDQGVTAMSADELLCLRESQLSAYRKALAQMAQEARPLVLPIVAAGVEDAKNALAAQLQHEREESARWGISFEPSEICAALFAAMETLKGVRDALEKPTIATSAGSSIAAMTRGLIEL